MKSPFLLACAIFQARTEIRRKTGLVILEGKTAAVFLAMEEADRKQWKSLGLPFEVLVGSADEIERLSFPTKEGAAT